MDTFWFVRHGETDYNLNGLRCGGDIDVPLNPTGEAQIQALIPEIKVLEIGLIISSGLKRTHSTALIISNMLDGIPIEIEPLFNERSLGEWNGRPIKETEPFMHAGQVPPGGESEEQFRCRILSALPGLRKKMTRKILMVSSKGVARVLNQLIGNGEQLHLANGELAQFTLRQSDQNENEMGSVPLYDS